MPEQLKPANDQVIEIAKTQLEAVACFGTSGLRDIIERAQRNAIRACAEIADSERLSHEMSQDHPPCPHLKQAEACCVRDLILALLLTEEEDLPF
jgi:hypothetical protein